MVVTVMTGIGSKLLRGGAATMLAKLAGAGLGLVLNLVLARSLPLQGYGAFSFGVALAGAISVVASLGLPFSAVRHLPQMLARGDTGAARRFEHFVMLVTWGGALVAAALAATAVLVVSGPEGLRALVLPLAVQVAAFTLAQSLAALLQAHQHAFLAELAGNVLRGVVACLALLAVLIAGRAPGAGGALGIFAAATLVSCVALAVLLHTARRDAEAGEGGAPVIGETPATWLRTGLAMLLVLSAAVLIERLDLIMLTAFGSLGETAIYSAAARLSMVLVLVLSGLLGHAAPRLSGALGRGERAEALEILNKVALFGSAALGIGALGLIGLGRPFLLLFGPEYASGWPALSVLALAQWSVAWFGLGSTFAVLMGAQRAVVVASLSALALNVAVNLVAIPRLGALGASLSTLVSLFSAQLVIAWQSRRRFGTRADVIHALSRRSDPRG